MSHPYKLEGKVALVTGGSRGIGLGIAREYIDLGAKVAITGQNPDNLAMASGMTAMEAFYKHIHRAVLLVHEFPSDSGSRSGSFESPLM